MHNAMYTHLPEPFCYYKGILKSDHLHFGLWREDNSQLSIEEAQQAMFEYLLSFFPPPPAKVLDVGCGLGLSAYLLAQKGYKVTAVAPSQEMIHYAQQTYGGNGIEGRAPRSVLSDLYYPGWRAKVNGKEEEIIKAFGLLRGVLVKDGKTDVAFYYQPVSLYLGSVISIVTFIAWLVFLLYSRGRKV